MIDFYALTSPNVQKFFIMLEECGLPYNIKPVDVWAGEQFTSEFAKINPLLKVPAIVDSDGPGGTPYTVIESGAILIYLAEKTGKFIPHDPVSRYDTLQWGNPAGCQCRSYGRSVRPLQQIRRARA